MIVCIEGRYFVPLEGVCPLEQAMNYQRSLVEMLKVACLSELFNGSGRDIFYVLELIELLQLSSSQIDELLKQDLDFDQIFSK